MYLTIPQREDAFGAQFLNLFRAIVFTETNGHTYIDTGINHMAIQEADDDPSYLDKIIKYMNINRFYLTPCDLPNGTEILILPHAVNFYHLYVADFLKMEISDSFKKYKKIFLHDKTNPHDNTFYNVVIHIRRTEKYQLIVDGKVTAYPDFSDAYYIEFCKKIRNEYTGTKSLRFHIYSLGKDEDFHFLKADDVILHINADLIKTHLHFIFADVLLISHSCLSYTAAFFSSGIIYYRIWNHLHLGLPTWIRYD